MRGLLRLDNVAADFDDKIVSFAIGNKCALGDDYGGIGIDHDEQVLTGEFHGTNRRAAKESLVILSDGADAIPVQGDGAGAQHNTTRAWSESKDTETRDGDEPKENDNCARHEGNRIEACWREGEHASSRQCQQDRRSNGNHETQASIGPSYPF